MENKYLPTILFTLFLYSVFFTYLTTLTNFSKQTTPPILPSDWPEPHKDRRVVIKHLDEVQSDPNLEIKGGFIRDIPENVSFYPETNYLIPKKLHWVWVGNMIPPKYQQNIRDFARNNSDYQCFLWTEKFNSDLKKNLSDCTVRNITQEMQEKAYRTRWIFQEEQGVGGKSDIIRYEIIYHEGGTYLDTDSKSAKPLKNLLTESFVINTYGEIWPYVCNGSFGFPKGSEFLDFVIRALLATFHQPNQDVSHKTGPSFFTGCYLRFNNSRINMLDSMYLLKLSDLSIVYQSFDNAWG